MNKRLFIPIFLVFACASLMAQPEIISITYNSEHEAILTSNTPPAGIVYYWQGSSCGTLMNHSGSTTVATTSGTYYIREYYSSGMAWATSCASTNVVMPDLTAPILSNVTPGPVDEGDPIAATSNEDGMIFLVPDGTATDYASISAGSVASATAVANVATALSTTGLALGEYIVFAADAAHNVSSGYAVTVTDLEAPVLSNVTAGPVEEGDNIAATSNEDGMIYLVPDGTAANVGAITAAAVADAAATASVAVSLSTVGAPLGNYIVYAVDGHDNVSVPSPAIAVADLTAPILSDVTAGPIEEGTAVAATSNEDGMIYLVPDGTAANVGAITAASVASATATATVPVALATAGIGLGDFIVFAVDGHDNVSAASAIIAVADLTAPVLSDVTAGPIEVGTDILASSNEDGYIYLVPDGTAPDAGAIAAAQVAHIAVSANVAGTLATTGIDLGDYVVYAVDASDNVSAASPAITVTAVSFIDLNNSNTDQVQLYPANVTDILYIRSKVQVSTAIVYSLQGAQMIKITTAVDQIDLSALDAGIYIVSLELEDSTRFSGKVTKQ